MQKALTAGKKTDTSGLTKITTLVHKKVKIQATLGGDLFAIHLFDKGRASRTHKELLEVTWERKIIRQVRPK